MELLFLFISPLVFPHPTALTSELSSFSFAVTFSLYSDLCCNLPDETCQPDLFLKCTTSLFYSFFCGFKASCVLLLCCLLCTSHLFSASGCLSSVGVYVLTLAAWKTELCWNMLVLLTTSWKCCRILLSQTYIFVGKVMFVATDCWKQAVRNC